MAIVVHAGCEGHVLGGHGADVSVGQPGQELGAPLGQPGGRLAGDAPARGQEIGHVPGLPEPALRHAEGRRERGPLTQCGALAERLKHSQEDARRIIEHIGRTYSPSRIYQWGSLVETRHFSEISDIDIGVEGLSGPKEYFAILGDAMRMSVFPVDLIELDRLESRTADGLRRRGRLVHERPPAG